MMFALLLESAVRSLVLAIAVCFGLKVFRVRGGQAKRVAWTVVLIAALSMPLLMQWSAVTLTAPAVTPEWITAAPPVVQLARQHVPQNVALPGPRNWSVILFQAYLVVSSALLLRLFVGLGLTLRLVWNAKTVRVSDDLDVCVSSSLRAPVTFGSRILLPDEWLNWDSTTRLAVLSHERSHVERGDFYIQLLASIHRVIFWFSPLAWWMQARLTELAELESDDAAIVEVADRSKYAEILLELANRPAPRDVMGIAMARPSTVSRRIERILAETAVRGKLGGTRRAVLILCIFPLIVLMAGSCGRSQAQVQRPPILSIPPALGSAPMPGLPVLQALVVPGVSGRTIQQRDSFVTLHNGTDAFGVVAGDYKTFYGSQEDARRAESLRDTIQGDYIWFKHDAKFYVITDPQTVQRAKGILMPGETDQQELSARQAELSAQQAVLGAQQAQLGEQQSRITVNPPDLRNALDELRARLDTTAARGLRQEDLAALQAGISGLQARLGESQAQAGARQAELGAQQARLGEEQAQLGRQQAALGQQQAKRAEEMWRNMQMLLEETLRNGQARSIP
jgi:beta-lactamase regulating signal transducer with metallopeptidase domain